MFTSTLSETGGTTTTTLTSVHTVTAYTYGGPTTIVTTSTATVTTGYTTTTTVAASSDFTPLASVIAASGGSPSKRKRETQPDMPLAHHDRMLAARANYAAQVICNTVLEIWTTSISRVYAPTRTVTAARVTLIVTVRGGPVANISG